MYVFKRLNLREFSINSPMELAVTTAQINKTKKSHGTEKKISSAGTDKVSKIF